MSGHILATLSTLLIIFFLPLVLVLFSGHLYPRAKGNAPPARKR